jgi:phosphomannomutase
MPSDVYHFHPSILRAYDIRGIVGETLSETDAYYIGRAFATLLQPATDPVIVGRDGRLSSPHLEAALVRGLQESGCAVLSVGLCSTPLLYYTVFNQSCAGGIMITGSHNPPAHNGFKLMRGSSALFGEEILSIGTIAVSGNFSYGEGSLIRRTPMLDYILRLLKNLTFSSELRVVWDTGNGAVGPILQELAAHLPFSSFLINAEVDGHFPSHQPDPSQPENLQEISTLVRQENYSVGIAFDGDGDRIAVIDELGNRVSVDHLLMLFARDILKRHPRATVIADVKTSQAFFSEVARCGGQPIMTQTGHSIIKAQMRETKALFAGEMSGHFFFSDTWYGFDDGLYTALRLLSLLSERQCSLSTLIQSLPVLYTTHERCIPCAGTRKDDVIRRVTQRLHQEGADFVTIDGVRVNTKQGWWLLRASNTEECLTTRAEGESPEALASAEKELQRYLGYGLEGDSAHV